MHKKYKYLIPLLAILMAFIAGAILPHVPSRKAADTSLLLCENDTEWYDYTT